MISRHEAAQRLGIPVEMARRHGIPTRLTDDELAALDASPPPWLVQSRANRAANPAARPVWVELTCTVCGDAERARPKKWWPEFTYLSCVHHSPLDLPPVGDGMRRAEFDGIGTRFVGIVDS